MARLEELQPGAFISGLVPGAAVRAESCTWHGKDSLTLIYRTPDGRIANEVLYRDDEPRLLIQQADRPWSFDGDGALFRLVAEAQRIQLAHIFDPMLAVHTSEVQPLPHQLTAVYEAMLPRLPLRFLLADDPGAGKTIMAGLLIKELMARGDVKRCLIVCPGSLADQWQDELDQKFSLPFEILTNDKLESARTGNWFLENDLAIARLDKLSRNEDVQAKLEAPECHYDLIVCDEAHKMSATRSGSDVSYTKRYRLGQLLSRVTRHFLLMTATPHNGKEVDFQLFLALLDSDRFEGRHRDGALKIRADDLMRRMVKEDLVKMDGTPLFPERRAYTVSYSLSPDEAQLYAGVTEYVRVEFNRAEALANNKRAGTVGFALTMLQRRLASSPEAIYQSLRRRKLRLEDKQVEIEKKQLGISLPMPDGTVFDADDIEDLDDAPESEIEDAVSNVLDQATAAATLEELRREIKTLERLEALADKARREGQDAKWRELAAVFEANLSHPASEVGPRTVDADSAKMVTPRKFVVFTEHRDTLTYLQGRISSLLKRPGAVVVIHGGVKREARRAVQEQFMNDPQVRVLLATDAAGEGINLQRAHLMVNYDLPWNPNRLEQRFGRIHRIGQTEVCHLWNLLAADTREGDVYRRLLEKLEEARTALGGRVFDVLGKLQFDGDPLRDLLMRAVRYGDQEDVRARLNQAVDASVDLEALARLLQERALDPYIIDAAKLAQVRGDMERAEAMRLQPHYVESFFLEAFKRLGGNLREREPRRYEVRQVPAAVMSRDRRSGRGAPVLDRYERIVFERELRTPAGMVRGQLLCPGQPLLDAVIDLTIEKHRNLLRQGAVLIDERDWGQEPRVLYFLDHTVHDAGTSASGHNRIVSRRMLYVEVDGGGKQRQLMHAPYLDYRPLGADEPSPVEILGRPECVWLDGSLDAGANSYAIEYVVPVHRAEVRARRIEMVEKTRVAVTERLTAEIGHWRHREQQLQQLELAGRPETRLHSAEARRRAADLEARLYRRTTELDLEAQISAGVPVILGGALIVPIGLLNAMMQDGRVEAPTVHVDTQAAAAAARNIIMDIERALGFEPTDREFDRLGYDIESRDPNTGSLRFIEVKGRRGGAATVTVTRNEVLTSLNQPDNYILALVEFVGDGRHEVRYVRQPFSAEPDFGVTSVNYDFQQLLARGEAPR